MLIVVSGTHASGKSTLISDFALRHPHFTVLPDPFELIDEEWDRPDAAMFTAQLRVAAERLMSDDLTTHVIAERGPLDFHAYLLALDEVPGACLPRELLERSASITAEALGHVDLLVVLPLSASDAIWVGDDEYPELRNAMNDVLMGLLEDSALIGTRPDVVEIAGDPRERLSRLESFVDVQ